MARKRELKANLASLPVPKSVNPTPYYWGAAAIIGLILGGLYFYNAPEKTTAIVETPKEELTTIEKTPSESTSTEEIAEFPKNSDLEKDATKVETIAEVEKNTNHRTKTSATSANKNVPAVSNKEVELKSETEEPINYNIQEPTVNSAIAEFDDVHENSDINAPTTNLTSTTEDNKVSEIVPKIESNNKSYRKYQYDGQNLTLVGDYNSDIPYVLYELKLDSKKQLYLKFENKYYEIKNTGTKTTKLETLTDPVVINELENK